MPFKNFTSEVLTSSDVDTYLMRQGVMTFATEAARDSALSGVLDEGMVTFQEDTDQFTVYTGAAWIRYGGVGAWTATTPTSANLTIGSGTIVGAYQLTGKTCEFHFRFILGAGSAVGSAPTITLPFTSANDIAMETADLCYFDATGGGTGRLPGVGYSSTSAILGLAAAAGTALSSTNPFTWASGDKIFGRLTFQTT